MMVIMLTLALILPTILIFINSVLFKKDLLNREKISPFECGFNPKNLARIPFSIRFYLIAVIFLIFDIEIALILPIPLIYSLTNSMYWSLWSSIFIIILLGGLYLEWNNGALSWSK